MFDESGQIGGMSKSFFKNVKLSHQEKNINVIDTVYLLNIENLFHDFKSLERQAKKHPEGCVSNVKMYFLKSLGILNSLNKRNSVSRKSISKNSKNYDFTKSAIKVKNESNYSGGRDTSDFAYFT